MAIKFHCPSCGQKIGAPDSSAGSRGKCPRCHGSITVPSAAEPAPEALPDGAPQPAAEPQAPRAAAPPPLAAAGPASAPPPPAPPAPAAPPASAPAAPSAAQPRKRPGGLTALAVLNFVFGGLGLFFLTALFALLDAANTGIRVMSDGQVGLADAPGAGSVYFMGLLGIVGVGLLIASGVGYLTQKRVLGYCLGNAYGILGICSTVLTLVLLGTGFGFSTILGLAYPIITLALLNTVFKNDFPN